LRSRGTQFETVQPVQDSESFFRMRAAIDGGRQQAPRFSAIAPMESGDALLHQLLRFALPFGKRTVSPLDVRPRARIAPIEKERAAPDVNRVVVVARKIVLETGYEQLFDLRVPIDLRRARIVVISAARLCPGHESGRDYNIEIDQQSASDNQYSTVSAQQSEMALIECIPNVSEGRRGDVVARMVESLRSIERLRLLDVSSDASHNRSVFTFAGESAGIEQGVLALFEHAVADIDLRTHRGEHPRMGAVDVVPFVPIEGVSMADCVALAKKVGAAIAERFHVPVYLYEEASANPLRRNLEDIRRGEFEGLQAKMKNEQWAPDFGPAAPHPSAGASAVGARMALVAYNINLATDRLEVAKKIAAAIRQSSGGYRFVKAAGFKLEERGIVQVSMNLTNYEKTPLFRVFETVKREAARYGVAVVESEIVGLVPSAALNAAAEFYLQIEGFKPDQVLENKLREV
jgi:glutamate formiminotransferase / 5-formyltetrahydrofolate cyclo-ligase